MARGRDARGPRLPRQARPLEPARRSSFCMGLGNAMNAPAWHAVVPEIVSGPQLAARHRAEQRRLQPCPHHRPGDRPAPARAWSACSCSSPSTPSPTWASSSPCGPGSGRPRRGPPSVARASPRPPAPASPSCAARPSCGAIFARGLCFFVPGIAMGTLLPVIGRFELGLDEFDFGILYGVFGVGAVAAAFADAAWINRLLGRRSRQHLGDGHFCRCHDAWLRSAMAPLRGRRRRRHQRRLLDHRHRQQRHLGADDPAQLHAGARHGGPPDGVLRRDGRGLAAVGKDRQLLRACGPR